MPSNFKIPAFYCAKCTNVLNQNAPFCTDCNGKRPNGGWNSIQDGYDNWLGHVLDERYLITKRIGRGSVGSVYRARSIAIERAFAIKIINFKNTPEGIDSSEIRARLSREVTAIGKLRNPHIVPFYETIELYDSHVGVVMDYIQGDTLEDLVKKEGPLSIPRILKIIKQIANGLFEVHSAGMIHRDVKPENLMVEKLPALGDFVHILDFGIVRVDDGASLTRGFIGTPLYASPEQAIAAEVDNRSDIYALGAVLYFMLTGDPPYTSTNIYDILKAHVGAPIPIASEKRKDISPELDALVVKLLSKSPTDRPSSLEEVIVAVDRILQSEALYKATFEPKLELEIGEESSELDSPSPKLLSKNRMGNEKSGIFKRGPTRGTVKSVIDNDKKERKAKNNFDYTLKTETGIRPLGKSSGTLQCVSKAGSLISLDNDKQIFRYQDGNRELYKKLDFFPTTICPDGEFVCVGTEDGKVLCLDEDADIEVFADIRRAPINSIDYHEDIAIIGSESGRIYMQRSDSLWTRIQDGPPVLCVVISQDGTLFAVALKTGEINIFRISEPKRNPVIRFTFSKNVRSMAFSTNSQLLAVVFIDNSVSIFNVVAGKTLSSIKADIGTILDISFDTKSDSLLGFIEKEGTIYGVDLQKAFSALRE